MDRPRNWVVRVNRPETGEELEALRVNVQRGRPFGDEAWIKRMAKRFGMESMCTTPRTTEGLVKEDSSFTGSTIAPTLPPLTPYTRPENNAAQPTTSMCTAVRYSESMFFKPNRSS